MRSFKFLCVALILSNSAVAQEDLLWKATSAVTPTLVPSYQNLGTPFKVRAKTSSNQSNEDEESRQQRLAQIEAERAASAAAQAEAERARQRQLEAERKAQKFANMPDVIVADFTGLTAEGVLQGPLGNSMLWQGQWLKEGTQLKVSTAISSRTAKELSKLQQTDAAAATLLTEKLQARLARQSTISITLVHVTSASAIFSDGRQRYTLPVSQAPF